METRMMLVPDDWEDPRDIAALIGHHDMKSLVGQRRSIVPRLAPDRADLLNPLIGL